MATKLALCFLPFLLFFLMNGHGMSSRDLKGEMQDHPDTNSQSYITNYITTANTQKEADSQSHLIGYKSQKKADSQSYLIGYKSQKEVNPQTYHGKHNEPYIANNIKTTRESKHSHPSHSHHANLNQPYITSYETSNAHDANKPNYLIGYRTSTSNAHDANEPNYLVGYRTSTSHDAIKPNYLIGYRTSTHGPDKDISLWSTNKAYIAGYTTTPYDAKKVRKESYITQYGDDLGGSNKETKQSGNDNGSKRDSYAPYIAQYGNDVGSKRDSNAPYVAQYGNDVGSKKDSNAPYITQYGRDIDPKRDSNAPYIAQYGLHSKNTQGLKGGPPSSNVDHTEAFKVGFFAMDDLYIGNIMTLQFPVEEFSHFLSKKEADSIPFSIPQLPSVLQLFSISQDSPQAKSMRATIEQCEAGTITGETKICANSLESMLEFVDNIIGSEEKHNIHTTSPPSGAPLQEYRIMKISEDIYAPKWVACHPLPYPYAVYYCHFISTGTRLFKVLLGGHNGDRVEALGVCHLDTSDWSPDHILFKQLGFMPGEAPVCHFFPVKHLMWVPQHSTATM